MRQKLIMFNLKNGCSSHQMLSYGFFNLGIFETTAEQNIETLDELKRNFIVMEKVESNLY